MWIGPRKGNKNYKEGNVSLLFLEAVCTACSLRYVTKANKASQFGFIFYFGKAEFPESKNCLVRIPGLIILRIDRFLEKIFFFLSYRIFFLVGSQVGR